MSGLSQNASMGGAQNPWKSEWTIGPVGHAANHFQRQPITSDELRAGRRSDRRKAYHRVSARCLRLEMSRSSDLARPLFAEEAFSAKGLSGLSDRKDTMRGGG